MKNYLFLTIMLFVVSACSQPFTVSVLFESPVSVHSGDDVRMNQISIGKVSQVVREDTGTRVYLSLDPEKSKTLRDGSAALISSDDGRGYVSVFNFRAGKKPLAAGGELVGLNNPIEYMGWQTNETLDFTGSAMGEVAAGLQKYFESEEWMEQRQQLQQALDQLGWRLRAI